MGYMTDKHEDIAGLNQSMFWTDYSMAAYAHLEGVAEAHPRLRFPTYEALRHLSNTGQIEADRAKAINALLESLSTLYFHQVASVLFQSLHEPLEEVVEAAEALQEELASWDEEHDED